MTTARARAIATRWAMAGILVLVLADLLLVSVLWNERQLALERGQAAVQQTASVTLRRAHALLEMLDRTLSGLVEAVNAHGATQERDDLYLHRLLVRRHAATLALDWLVLADTTGMTVTSSRSFPAPQLYLGDREYITAQQQDWEKGLYIGLPIVSRRTDTPVVPISRRMTNDGGRLTGIVAAGLKVEFLQALINDPAPPAGMVIGLFRDDGHALACLPSMDACPDAPLDVMHRLAGHAAGASASGDAIPVPQRLLGGGAGVAAYRASDSYPLFVVTDFPAEPLLAPWHANLPAFTAIALGGNLALVIIGLYAYRQVMRRRQALEALAAANAVLEERVRERTEDLARLANTDVLTGAYNRRWYMNEGERLFALARRHQRPLALMILDADRFKSINDRYGHAAGDAVLRTMTAVPGGVLRGSDVFARLGGEEFGVLLPETAEQGAREVGERLLGAFRDSSTVHDGQTLRFTVSIGLAQIAPTDANLEALIHRADQALYRAKEDGRDRLVSADA